MLRLWHSKSQPNQSLHERRAIRLQASSSAPRALCTLQSFSLHTCCCQPLTSCPPMPSCRPQSSCSPLPSCLLPASPLLPEQGAVACLLPQWREVAHGHVQLGVVSQQPGVGQKSVGQRLPVHCSHQQNQLHQTTMHGLQSVAQRWSAGAWQ